MSVGYSLRRLEPEYNKTTLILVIVGNSRMTEIANMQFTGYLEDKQWSRVNNLEFTNNFDYSEVSQVANIIRKVGERGLSLDPKHIIRALDENKYPFMTYDFRLGRYVALDRVEDPYKSMYYDDYNEVNRICGTDYNSPIANILAYNEKEARKAVAKEIISSRVANEAYFTDFLEAKCPIKKFEVISSIDVRTVDEFLAL